MSTKQVFKKTIIAQQVSASALAFALAAPLGANAQEQVGSGSLLEEVVVTASRRSESQQDVAIALQAIGETKLDELRIDSFEDYVALIPGVNSTGQGPGKKEVFIRGISPGRTAVRVAALGSEPSVAFYLDETPISTGGRNIDLYSTDLNRIEVLKGPQGTLFGASSQAGTLRLITNKPVMNEVQAGVTVDLSDTSGGDGSQSIDGYVNIPLVEDTLAARVVAYSSKQGGFIDNISATRQIPLTNPGFGGTVPGFRATVNNDAFVGENLNEATYKGVRASLAYQVNDEWDVSLQYTSQSLDTEGIFEYEPEVSSKGDLNFRTFNRDFGVDDVDLLAWAVNGSIGSLDVVYNGSYTERLFEGQTDYTGYANTGPFIPYYICTYPGYASCGSPALFSDSFFETKRDVHEVRIATDDSRSWKAIFGVFYDDQETIERTNFVYPSSVEVGFQPNFPIPDASATDPNVRFPGVTFFNDFLSPREELSFFGEVSFDITDKLTATFGARRYSIDIGLEGQSSFGQRAAGPQAAGGQNVDRNLAGQSPTELSDTIIKANLSYDIGDDALVYGTYSEGFRSGGFNRAGTGNGPRDIPFFFESDDAKNYEFGWKTQLLDNSLRLNGAVYFVDFTDLQQGVLDFSISNLTFFDNVGTAEIKGAEFDLEWAPSESWNVFGAFSYIDAELTELPPVIANISPAGSTLPFAPKTQITVGARYETEFGDYRAFGQGLAKYTDDRFTSLVQVARFPLDSYTEVDVSAGVSTDKWSASLYVDNLTDELGQLDAGAPDLIFRVIPIRPRTIGLRFTYDY